MTDRIAKAGLPPLNNDTIYVGSLPAVLITAELFTDSEGRALGCATEIILDNFAHNAFAISGAFVD